MTDKLEIKAFYATDVPRDFFQKIQKGKTLFVYFDGMTDEEERQFMEKCQENEIAVYKMFTIGMNARKHAIIESGGYMDGNVCRPFPYFA